MIRSLQVALRQAGDEIKAMEIENQQQKVDLFWQRRIDCSSFQQIGWSRKVDWSTKTWKRWIIAKQGSCKNARGNQQGDWVW